MSSLIAHTQNTQNTQNTPMASVITNMSYEYVTGSPTHSHLHEEALARQGLMMTHNGRVTAAQEHNGRQTAAQEIKTTRRNQPSPDHPYAEFWDNSIGWGRAKKVLTVFNESSIVLGDSGNFRSEDHFKKMFLKTKLGNESRYHANDENLLGTYNFGSTDSVINMGGSATAYHNFSGVLKKTVFDLSQYKRDNTIHPNIQFANEGELFQFKYYMKLLDPNYDMTVGGGTIIKVENLLKKPNQTRMNNVVKFAKGLYCPEKYDVSIHMFNHLNNEWPQDAIPTQIIRPIDITYGAQVETETIYVYLDENDERIHTKLNLHTTEGYELKGEYKIDTWVLNASQRAQEMAYFGNTNDSEMVGFSVYRAGRKITPNPKKWDLKIGMSRARGIRMRVRYPSSAFLDEVFGCGTQKTLTDENWEHFDESMKRLFQTLFSDLQKNVDKLRWLAQKTWTDSYKAKIVNVCNLDYDNAVAALVEAEAHFNENFDTREGLIKKRSGKAYNTWKTFCDNCRERIASFDEQIQDDGDDVGSHEDEIVDEEAEEEPVVNRPSLIEEAQLQTALHMSSTDNVENVQQQQQELDEEELDEEDLVEDELVEETGDITQFTIVSGVAEVPLTPAEMDDLEGILYEENDDDESDTSSLASSYDSLYPNVQVEDENQRLLGEIQAGVGELIARMKEEHPYASAFLDTYGSSMVLMLEEEKNSFA